MGRPRSPHAVQASPRETAPRLSDRSFLVVSLSLSLSLSLRALIYHIVFGHAPYETRSASGCSRTAAKPVSPSLTIPLFLSLRTAGTTLIPLFFLSIFEQNKDVVVLDGRLCWFSPLMPACLSLYRSVPLSLSLSLSLALSLFLFLSPFKKVD